MYFLRWSRALCCIDLNRIYTNLYLILTLNVPFQRFAFRKWTTIKSWVLTHLVQKHIHTGFFRLLIKGIFDPYLLWPFDKKLISWLAQIREQMSGPDLHVFTLKFLALKRECFYFFLPLFYATFQCEPPEYFQNKTR